MLIVTDGRTPTICAEHQDSILPKDTLDAVLSRPSTTTIPGPLVYSQFEAHPLYTPGDTPYTMTNGKKRRSIGIPSFSTPSFMTHRKSASSSRSHSYVDQHQAPAGHSPDDPPPFLLDDDPFANLTTSPLVSPPQDKKPSPPLDPAAPAATVPRSPLSPPDSVQSSYFGSVTPQTSTPLSPRFRSLRIKPAYEKPAFSARPSLPSLYSLAHMSVSPPKKVRKGRVGARLPFEPWEALDSDECGEGTPCATRPSSPLAGCARVLAQDISAFPFTFHDNISTPSLELSSASLSRSLSLESISLSELSPSDSEHDQFGNFASEHRSANGDHDIDHLPRELMNLLLPSLYPDRGDKLAYDLPLPTISELPLEFQAGSSPDMQTDSTGWSSSSRACSSSLQFAQGSGSGGHTSHDGSSQTGNGSWGGGNGQGDDDGDGGRRRPTHRIPLSGSSTPGTSSDEEDSEEEDYGKPIRATVTDSEDDVPLAQRIPTALKAQHTIRQKFREERDKRRRQRAVEAEKKIVGQSESGLSSSQEAALQASKQAQGCSRTRTLPSNAPRPFAPEDLARKLQDVQVAGSQRRPSTSPREVARGRATSPNRDATLRFLHSMRSFHRSEAAQRCEEAPMSTDMTTIATSIVGRATSSRARSRVREETPPSAWLSPPLPPRLSLENSPSVPPLPQPPRLSTEAPRRKLSSATSVTKTSVEIERSPKPLPPPQAAALAVASIKTQQRIFIGDMQRFNVVEIDNNTNADDVVVMVRNQGLLAGSLGQGDWMLFEIAQDFGMERPIRGYELLSDVQASWNKDKLVNTFVLKMTPLAGLLSREGIPSSSPTCGGYVEWESKKGKWSKRWLRLREHSLWLSKRDNGKDEVLICSLSNFDAYFVTRGGHKAPKPFCFAVKSTDNLSFFENTADYLHTFSCKPQDGQKWVERILIARSYVLHQERHVLFNPKAASGSAATAVTVQRAGTRKVRPAQPLVNIAPSEVFEPGSLLSRS